MADGNEKKHDVDAQSAHETFARVLDDERCDGVVSLIDGVLVVAARAELAESLALWWAHELTESAEQSSSCDCSGCRRNRELLAEFAGGKFAGGKTGQA